MAFELNRRSFVQGLAAVAGSASSVHCARSAEGTKDPTAAEPPSPLPQRPVVALARREGVLKTSSGDVHAPTLRAMLSSATVAATGDPGYEQSLRKRFRSTDVVGLKVSALAGRGLSPHPQLVAELVSRLVSAGVKKDNILIWDRTDDELAEAGFTLNREGAGVRCYGTNQDYDWTPREWGAGGSCFARVLVEELTALINVAVLKDHDLAGISAGLKNWYGVIHNPNKHHDRGCDPYVAYLAASPLIRSKLRLTVIDGLAGQCHGGPAKRPRWRWPYNGLLVSTDPVAVDAVCWRIIEERRQELGLPSLTEEQREPHWIATAHEIGLGESRPEHINVVEV